MGGRERLLLLAPSNALGCLENWRGDSSLGGYGLSGVCGIHGLLELSLRCDRYGLLPPVAVGLRASVGTWTGSNATPSGSTFSVEL